MTEDIAQKIQEPMPDIGLTPEEQQVLAIAETHLQANNYLDGFKAVRNFVEGTGCIIELVHSGSGPNRGSLLRNEFFPKGKITLMATPNDTPESQLRTLVHEFLYLRLLIQALPDPKDKYNRQKMEHAIEDFIQGLNPRIEADIMMAKTIKDDKEREAIVSERTELLKKMQDRGKAYKMATGFILYH